MPGIRRATAYAIVVLLSGLLTLPALSWAGSGGSSVSPSGGSSSSTGPGVQAGDMIVTATGDGITLSSHASTLLRNQVSFGGTASPNAAGRTIEIERLGHQTNWQWAPTVSATIARGGSFHAVWKANHIGRFSIRAVISQPASSNASAAAPTVTITVYRSALATLYGPGFYGQQTACGQRLGRSTIGVANRTLKCGTKVAIYYRGRTMVVPVIDRGPYANGADWDLTEATGRAIGINTTVTIGAVSLPKS